MIFRVFDNNGNLLHEAGNFAALEVEVKAELGSKPSRLQPIKASCAYARRECN